MLLFIQINWSNNITLAYVKKLLEPPVKTCLNTYLIFLKSNLKILKYLGKILLCMIPIKMQKMLLFVMYIRPLEMQLPRVKWFGVSKTGLTPPVWDIKDLLNPAKCLVHTPRPGFTMSYIVVPFLLCSLIINGILSTTIVFFSYPKLLSFSVLTFIKWRLSTELLANTLRNAVY